MNTLTLTNAERSRAIEEVCVRVHQHGKWTAIVDEIAGLEALNIPVKKRTYHERKIVRDQASIWMDDFSANSSTRWLSAEIHCEVARITEGVIKRARTEARKRP